MRTCQWPIANAIGHKKTSENYPITKLLTYQILSGLFQFDRLGQPEGQSSFGLKHNVLIARECGPGGSCASACGSADGSAFTASGQRADQGTCACAAANESSRPLAFTF